tara:strand:+ start:203 stop:979 length:777 start_codon:yes stop_codon:yes gene_type:complete
MHENNDELPVTISKVFDVLEKHNVFFWLDAGSLLKGIRDKSILTSSDIDVSVTYDQTNNILFALDELADSGYHYHFNGGYPMLEDMVTVFLPEMFNRIKHIDIYIFHRSDDMLFRRCFHKPIETSKSRYLFYLSKKIMAKTLTSNEVATLKLDTNINFSITRNLGKFIFYLYELVGTSAWHVIPVKYLSDFKKVYIHRRQFNVPVIWEQYLEMRYGADWETPKDRKKWFNDWRNSNNHIIKRKKLRTEMSINKYWFRI